MPSGSWKNAMWQTPVSNVSPWNSTPFASSSARAAATSSTWSARCAVVCGANSSAERRRLVDPEARARRPRTPPARLVGPRARACRRRTPATASSRSTARRRSRLPVITGASSRAQPTEPSICSWIRRFISTAYSSGSSFVIGSTKPDDDHRARLRLGEAAAHEVEELLLADLRDRRLVAEVDVVLLHVDVRVRVGARVLVEDQRVADDLRLRAGRALRDLEQAAVAAAPAVLRDRLRRDHARRVLRDVDDLAARVLVLALAGERDREHLAVRALAHQPDRRGTSSSPWSRGCRRPTPSSRPRRRPRAS